MSMQAVQFNAKENKLKYVLINVAIVKENEVKVEVHYAGICGTDLHIIDGTFPCKQDGLVLGHEFSGVVKEIGQNVTHVKVGDKVVTDPNRGCMVCKCCRTGRPHYCETGGLNSTIGIYVDGGWAQYTVVPETQVHKLPESLTLQQASLCEPMSCLSHTWERISPIPLGSRILVIGSGIIGNLFVSLLHLKGHRKVTVSEPNNARLKITHGLNLGYDLISPDILKMRQENDANYLFDFIFDASGNADAIEHAVTLMDFGAKLCMFGVANPSATINISPFTMFKKELSIFGCVINPFSFPNALSILGAMGQRYISFGNLGIQTFKLEEYKEAISTLRAGTIAKATFKIK